MNTFTHEEEKLVIVIAACFLMASAVLLCCPEYDEKIVLSATRTAENMSAPNGKQNLFPGEIPVNTSRPGTATTSGNEIVDVSNKLDPNFATYEELIQLPGIGPSTAKALLAYREKHILFSPNDLKRIKGIGPLKLSKLRNHLIFSTKPDGK